MIAPGTEEHRRRHLDVERVDDLQGGCSTERRRRAYLGKLHCFKNAGIYELINGHQIEDMFSTPRNLVDYTTV